MVLQVEKYFNSIQFFISFHIQYKTTQFQYNLLLFLKWSISLTNYMCNQMFSVILFMISVILICMFHGRMEVIRHFFPLIFYIFPLNPFVSIELRKCHRQFNLFRKIRRKISAKYIARSNEIHYCTPTFKKVVEKLI